MLDANASLAPVGIAGTGRMAQALGHLLLKRGAPVVCVAGRDPARARAAARFIGAGVEQVNIAELPRHASRLLIAVSDDALAGVAELLAEACQTGVIALHTCGARGEEALAPLQRRGAACGAMHPLQTISSAAQGVAALPGSAFAISGDAQAVSWAARIVEQLGGQVLCIAPDARVLYHVAAVMASNYLVALTGAAQRLLAEAAGIDDAAALRALAPLIRASAANVLDSGSEAALTGPIERGDAGTIRRHLDALAAAPPEVRALYRAAGLQTLSMARRKGLALVAVEQLETILRGN